MNEDKMREKERKKDKHKNKFSQQEYPHYG